MEKSREALRHSQAKVVELEKTNRKLYAQTHSDRKEIIKLREVRALFVSCHTSGAHVLLLFPPSPTASPPFFLPPCFSLLPSLSVPSSSLLPSSPSLPPLSPSQFSQEVEVLKVKSSRVDKLQVELNAQREKLEEAGRSVGKMKEWKSRNEIILEAKARLEDEVERLQEKAEQLGERRGGE